MSSGTNKTWSRWKIGLLVLIVAALSVPLILYWRNASQQHALARLAELDGCQVETLSAGSPTPSWLLGRLNANQIPDPLAREAAHVELNLSTLYEALPWLKRVHPSTEVIVRADQSDGDKKAVVPPESLAPLADLRLTTLGFVQCKLPSDFDLFTRLRNVKVLLFADCTVSPEALAGLAECKQLKILLVSGSDFDDRHVNSFCKLTHLSILVLSMDVDEQGTPIPVSLSDDGIEQVRNALPNTEIRAR